MPVRMLRETVWTSDRFVELKSNTDRLCLLRCLSAADDLGNFEASPGALVRLWRDLKVDSTELAARVATELAEADLIRWYAVDGKRYGHIPRFRQRLRHSKRVCPEPPPGIKWISDKKEGNENNVLHSKTSDGSPPHDGRKTGARLPHDGRSSLEVKRSEEKRSSARTHAPARVAEAVPADAKIAFLKNEGETPPPRAAGQQWDHMAYVEATAKTLRMLRAPGEDDAAFRDRVYCAVQERRTRSDAA